ncbi:MAG TPA: helix-turn-helix transcriptional regulator [Myxococcaceae bacterium]|nr:helix-turn-helix transcriptional regulator [Myxococcaceae bacterium]
MEKVDIAPHRAPGDILRDLRKVLAPEGARKLTQAGLAERLGYDDGYLQSIETGRRPMPPHLVDRLAGLEDDARFPDAFARLIEELRASVAAYRAEEAARPPVIGGPPASAGALGESVAGKLEEKLDALRGSVDGLSARAEGRLDGLGGKLDKTEGTLAVLGSKLETTSARTEVALGKNEVALGALGGRVEETSARTVEALGALGGKVDAASTRTGEVLGALGEKMAAASARTDGQLNEVAANVAEAGNKLDRTDAKVESVRTQAAQTEKKVTRKLDMLIRVLCANFIGMAALLILQCHRAPSAVQPAQGGTASIGVGQGAAEVAPKSRCIDDPSPPCLRRLGAAASGELGKTPAEKWVPPEPMQGQAPPPCDEAFAEKAINGGCWQRTDVKPPCGKLWRHGDSCYRPIAADPKQPLGDEPRQVTPEHQKQWW